jgi:cysteine desulfurase
MMSGYLDHNATTVLDERVLDAMLPYLRTSFGNPSSVHGYGRNVRGAVDTARQQVAAAVGVQPDQVIFTSGGTEANNLALHAVTAGAPGHIIVGATEHPSVLAPAAALQARGWRIDRLPVDDEGRVCRECLPALLCPDTRLVSVMMANNETGVVTDVAAIRDMLPTAVKLHTDAVQALGKLELDFAASGADMMSLSAHKINGPAGIGALIVDRVLEPVPLIYGGGQERGRRAGTENVAAIVGFGRAAELAVAEASERRTRRYELRQHLERRLLDEVPGLTIFGRHQVRLDNTVFFAVPMIDGESLVMALDQDGFAVASGSACSSDSPEASHVLLAMGIDPNLARCAVRVSLGDLSDGGVVDRFVDSLKFQVDKLNNLAVLGW